MTRSFFSALAFLAVAGSAALAGESIDPAQYTSVITNPWLPLTAGKIFTYEGTKDDKPATQILTVASKTKTLAGVDCTVVEDVMSLAGRPADRTLGYYAQDKSGNVWYFGEDVQELNAKGKVTKVEGWHAGIDGALPALVMEAEPVEGGARFHAFTNEHGEIVSLKKSVKTPMGAFTDALLVKEWTPDEPDVLSNKYFVRNIGAVRDVAVKGDKEEFLLVDVKP